MRDEEKIIRIKTHKDFDRELARDGDKTLEVPAWIAEQYHRRFADQIIEQIKRDAECEWD